MDYSSNIDDQLWNYIDGALPSSEVKVIEQLIRENSEWKERYNELFSLNQLLHSTEPDMPSMRFTQNVMEQIARTQISPAAKKYIDKKVIWGIAGFISLMLFALLIVAITKVSWTSGNGNDVIGDHLGSVNWSFLNNSTLINGFLAINIILGLMFFDRFLANQKKKLQER